MDFALDARTQELREQLLDFMAEKIVPGRAASSTSSWRRWTTPGPGTAPVLQELRAEARERGLWNLFLPGRARRRADQPPVRAPGRDHRPQPAPRPGRAQLRRARHRQHGGAGRMFGSPEQKEQWLNPLLRRRDPLGLRDDRARRRLLRRHQHRHAIVRDGDEYVINGRKWWITGAMNPQCAIFIVMGKTDPEAERHRQQSMVLVPPRHPGRRGRAPDDGLRVRRPRPRRPRRAALRGRPGAGRAT